MLPDFFVIGAQKAGSTYLLECLGEHPQVFMPPAEVAFFEDPLYRSEDLAVFVRYTHVRGFFDHEPTFHPGMDVASDLGGQAFF